jgi:hypothetical protein
MKTSLTLLAGLPFYFEWCRKRRFRFAARVTKEGLIILNSLSLDRNEFEGGWRITPRRDASPFGLNAQIV